MTDWKSGAVSAEAVAGKIESGHAVFVHGAAATPTPLLAALARRTDVEAVQADLAEAASGLGVDVSLHPVDDDLL